MRVGLSNAEAIPLQRSGHYDAQELTDVNGDGTVSGSILACVAVLAVSTSLHRDCFALRAHPYPSRAMTGLNVPLPPKCLT